MTSEHDPLIYISMLLLLFTCLVFGGLAVWPFMKWKTGMKVATSDHYSLAHQVPEVDAASSDYTGRLSRTEFGLGETIRDLEFPRKQHEFNPLRFGRNWWIQAIQ